MLVSDTRPRNGVQPDVAQGLLFGVLEYAMAHDGETFRERVKRLRERTGLSQIEFADKAGLSREGYQKIERGLTARPDIDTVRAIAKTADVRVSSLSRMLGWVPIDEVEDDWMSALTDDQRELVMQLINQIRGSANDPPELVRPRRAVRS